MIINHDIASQTSSLKKKREKKGKIIHPRNEFFVNNLNRKFSRLTKDISTHFTDIAGSMFTTQEHE